jgi:hypothetical protein
LQLFKGIPSGKQQRCRHRPHLDQNRNQKTAHCSRAKEYGLLVFSWFYSFKDAPKGLI